MENIPKVRQRRRTVLTCFECRKRKQKCDRRLPCAQCIVRGTETTCGYDKPKSRTAGGSSLSNNPAPSQAASPSEDQEALLQLAHDYGYSKLDSLNSLGMLRKVITDLDVSTSATHPVISSQVQSRIRAEYYGYVRRIPPRMHCELIFQQFFAGVNQINAALDETIFRDQLNRWWGPAHDILLKGGPEKIPEELRFFPALIFQVLAFALQFMSVDYDPRLDELKFGPAQTFLELSEEYTNCGVALSRLAGRTKPTLVGVQQSLMRDWWLINAGYIEEAWTHSGQTVKDAMMIGLHLEPEMPSFSDPEALLDVLWANQLRKRIWVNLFVWDNFMGMALGRPMFINPKDVTITPPLDCVVPEDRLKRVPVARSGNEKPTPMTERLLRYEMTLRICEIRELENQGSVPQDHEKVKELHHFAINFRKNLPPFYRTANPDTTWDAECHFVPTNRELLSTMVDAFLMHLHRPYIFTRERSQRQVYETSLAILDSQDRLAGVNNTTQARFYISITFPTFDAAVLLAVVLVSNPDAYRATFSRPYRSLKNAYQRLAAIAPHLSLARTGAEIIQSTLHRVMEAQQRVGGFVPDSGSEFASPTQPSVTTASSSVSPDADPWQFDIPTSAMEWASQNPEFSEFDFSNPEVPMPLKELILDTELGDMDGYDSSLWMPISGSDTGPSAGEVQQETVMDGNFGGNALWDFFTSYPKLGEPGYS